MDGWVSDKFYSYFPSYNDEDKKRQASLYEKQLEYEKNYIKLINDNTKKNSSRRGYNNDVDNYNLTQQPYTSRFDNRYDFDGNDAKLADGNSARSCPANPLPGSSRFKLLQDLQHTNISNINNDMQDNYLNKEMVGNNKSIKRVYAKEYEDDQFDVSATRQPYSSRSGKTDELNDNFISSYDDNNVGKSPVRPGSTTRQPYSSRSGKTDELNDNFISSYDDNNVGKSPVRPGSTRFKLLQDLQHTELSKMMFNNAIQDRNQNRSMIEIEKKKNYQKDLIKQIEEKRLQAEKIKEKERLEEEALNRKMELQYKTVLLEEELEREKHRMDKIRFDSDQKKLMREHLLRKLENDRILLSAREKAAKIERSKDITDRAQIEDRKIYKYFSNSARTEYNPGGRLRSLNTINFEVPELDIYTPRDYDIKFQDKDCNACNFCRLKLNTYETWCLTCNRQIKDKQSVENLTYVCENCQRAYVVCTPCEKIKSICEICNNKPNVCKKCIQNICIKCGKSIKNMCESFQLRNVSNNQINYDTLLQNLNQAAENTFEESYDELNDYVKCDKSYNEKKLLNSKNNYSNDNEESFGNNQSDVDISLSKYFDVSKNLDAIRIDTNDRLARYMQNYGDLAIKRRSKSRSTQTTPKLNSNRNLNANLMVQNEKHFASMKHDQTAIRNEEVNDSNKRYMQLNKRSSV